MMSRPPDEPQRYRVLKAGDDLARSQLPEPEKLAGDEAAQAVPTRPANHPNLASKVAQLPGLGVSNEFVAKSRSGAEIVEQAPANSPDYVEIAKGAKQKESNQDRDRDRDTPEIDR